jgi:hypothetical protein
MSHKNILEPLPKEERSRSLNPASWKKGLGSVYFIFIDALHVC